MESNIGNGAALDALDARGIALDPTITEATNAALHVMRIGDVGARGGTILGFFQMRDSVVEVAYDENEPQNDGLLLTIYPKR